MADRRKLYGEIERCLKKVTEGVEAFEDIWKKVYSATNTNQKEKYEADLKKEIKKLQRLRDQIKTWMTSSDIKDKRDLQNARKLIETQMERFKIVERETKTKAYSKEGLGAAQKLDPAQKERDEMTTWLTACLECLNIQVDKFESEMDAINFALKKKKNDKEKVDRSEDLKKRTEKHKYHIKQLEALLRMLDNGTVAVDQIRKIQEDVEYYRDCSQEDDFQENEFIYDDFDLQDLEDYLAKQQNEIETKTAEEDSSQSQSTTGTHSPSPSFENHTCDREPESVDSTISRNSPSPPNVICDPPVLHNCQPVINSPPPPPPPSTLTVSPSIQPIAATEPEVNNTDHDHVWTDANCNHVDFNLSSSKSVIFDDAQSSLKTLAEKVVLNSNHLLHLPTLHNSSEPIFLSKGGSAEIDISQIFGSQNKYSDGQKRALAILEAAHNTLPLTTDSQRFRYLSPGGPAKTPDYYPSNAPNSNSMDFFTRLSTETLFFIFYFLQGTKAQYLAARALKTKSWRFHTMFMMWFQRHEEPKAITDDFEQGTYVYFDYEKWMQRKKEGFIFEYKYLEDKDLN